MTNQTDLKSQSLQLAPFINFVIIYFLFVRDPHGELWTTLLKCAPVMCLMVFILLKGFAFSNEFKCSQRILIGLICSCAGDALLNVDLFPHGMGAFALAQICYISAFGWKPLKLIIGVPLYVAGTAMVAVVFKSLDDVLVFGLPIYAGLLLTMCWRSMAQGAYKKDFFSVFCAAGSVLFVISDGLICVNMFFIEVPHAQIWIMITYYTAQFAITLSTCNENEELQLKRSSKHFLRRDPHGELWTTLLKCAPVMCLMVFILLKGFAFSNEFKCSQRILIGLICSCAGDALLNVDLFPHGMGAFALAQICYISAFGWKPLKLIIGVPLYVAGTAMVAVVFKSLDDVLVFGLPIYAGLLLTMCWRSMAQGAYKKDFFSVFCAAGSVLFVISDGLICVNMFFIEVPHAQIWIMITYYTAQFAITLSTCNENEELQLKRSSKHFLRRGKSL